MNFSSLGDLFGTQVATKVNSVFERMAEADSCVFVWYNCHVGYTCEDFICLDGFDCVSFDCTLDFDCSGIGFTCAYHGPFDCIKEFCGTDIPC